MQSWFEPISKKLLVQSVSLSGTESRACAVSHWVLKSPSEQQITWVTGVPDVPGTHWISIAKGFAQHSPPSARTKELRIMKTSEKIAK